MSELVARIRKVRTAPAAIAAQLVVLTFCLQAAIVALSTSGASDVLTGGTARLTLALYSLTGVPGTVVGSRIYLQDIVLTINEDCSGLFVLAGYVALVASYPASGRSVARALCLGIPALVAANLTRLLLVGHICVRLPWAFGMVHDVLFRVAMALVAILLWYALSVRAAPRRARGTRAAR